MPAPYIAAIILKPNDSSINRKVIAIERFAADTFLFMDTKLGINRIINKKGSFLLENFLF